MWNASTLNGYAIKASDGQIGTVRDLLFEDTSWTIRWLVVDTGNWLSGRTVLLPTSVLGTPDPKSRQFPISLTMQQVNESPDIDADLPVSRQNESHIYDYFGEDPYWGGGLYPVSNAIAVPFLAPRDPAETLPLDDKDGQTATTPYDSHLRSINAVSGYHIHASDGAIGHISDFLVDETKWTIPYMIIDTSNFLLGKSVLISPQSVQEIDWATRVAKISVDRQKVKDGPLYEPEMTIDGAYNEKFLNYYGIAWGLQ